MEKRAPGAGDAGLCGGARGFTPGNVKAKASAKSWILGGTLVFVAGSAVTWAQIAAALRKLEAEAMEGDPSHASIAIGEALIPAAAAVIGLAAAGIWIARHLRSGQAE